MVITGANAGIGKEAARDLSSRGAKVIIGSRNLPKSQEVAKEISRQTGNEVVPLVLDLASFTSVKQFAKDVLEISYDKIDILINNAGIMMIEQETTEDGNEKQFQVNHLGHFLLTNLIIQKCLPSRIINLSSLAHTSAKSLEFDDLNLTKSGYGRIKAYANSKLANILFTKELHRRYHGHGISTFAVHPGAVATEISVHIENWFPSWWNNSVGAFIKAFFLKTSENGAQTTIYCAVQENIEDQSGLYFA